MKRALIGHTGFVGSNLVKILHFQDLYNSKNITELTDKSYDELYIAAPSAVKWLANKEPIKDLSVIRNILEILKTVNVKKVFLFSTVDVYGEKVNLKLNEDYDLNLNIHPYGRNRAIFESYISDLFDHSIIRLPALFGHNLKKNIIFDLLNNNMLHNISLKSSFQWFDLNDLGYVIDYVSANKIKIFNCVTEPIKTETIINSFFLDKKHLCIGDRTNSYYLKSKYFDSGFIYDKNHVLEKINIFVDKNKK